MRAPVIRFRTAFAMRANDGAIVVALVDGDPPQACVAILIASAETAQALVASVGSAIKSDDR